MLKILTAPAAVLNTPAKKVEKVDDSLRKLVSEMKKTLSVQKDPQGVGLAAPQVGVSLALFVMRSKEGGQMEVFINPKILKKDKKLAAWKNSNKKARKTSKDTALEGCLSIPKIWGPVKRAARVLIEYEDLSEKKLKKWFSGLKSVIVQHEIDHLNGVLFTQKALEQKGKLYEEKGQKLVAVKT